MLNAVKHPHRCRMPGETLHRFGRVGVRPTTEQDLSFVLEAEQDPANAAYILPWPRAQHLEALSDETVAHWIVLDAPAECPVGFLILAGVGGPTLEFKRVVIQQKGQGYGREVLGLVKRVAFEHFGAHRLWLDVMEHNTRARRLYETEGFAIEGTLREALRGPDGYVSLIVMSMLEEEYNRWKQT